jgi:hypothetical protein
MTRYLFSLLCAGVLVAAPSTAHGQTQSVTTFLDTQINTVAGEIAERKKTNPAATLLEGDIDLYAARGVQLGTLARLLADFEEVRSDEQIGATSTASGTTTLVSKGTVPKIFSFAMENGAISRSQSGTTLTFRGTVAGVADVMAGKGFIKTSSSGVDPAHDLLKLVSFSASFDTSRGSTPSETATFKGDQQQLSQWSLRAQLVDRRDPLRPEYARAWQALSMGPTVALNQAAAALGAVLRDDPAFKTWFVEASSAIAAIGADAAAVRSALVSQMDRFPLAALRQSTVQALANYDRTAAIFTAERQRILNDIAAGPQVALELTNDRPTRGPTTSNYRVVGTVGGSFDLTGNASMSLFNTIPLGASRRVRDVQVSGELSVRLGSIETTGPFVVAFAGKFVHQYENSFDESGIVVPDTKGTTAIGQLKLTIPVKGSGVRMPLSVTFANRTDLIKEKQIRGNVGISYDLDMLFARFKP